MSAEKSAYPLPAVPRLTARPIRPTCDHFQPEWLKSLPLLLALVVVSAGSAARAEDVLQALHACESEQNDSRRLACYDHALNRPAAKPAERPATEKQPPAASTAAAAEQFGMNEQVAKKLAGATPPQPHLDKLQSRVVGVSYKLRGEPIVRLENGQVWEGLEGSKRIEIKVGEVVTIWPGLFGSYRLEAGTVVTPVTRVR
jgi:hypothetical protein